MMNPKSRRARGDLLDRLADGPFAALTILHARRYVADYPRDAWGWTMLGLALREVCRFDEAEQALRVALDLFPPEDRVSALHQMGRLFEESGRPEEASRWYLEAIDAAPNDASHRIFLGAMFARLGRFAEAEEQHRAATRCGEGAIDEAYLNLGFVLRAQDRLAEAAACFREAIRLDPGYNAARRALRDVERCLRCASTDASPPEESG
jgi:Flp pilus assembly protein TadD